MINFMKNLNLQFNILKKTLGFSFILLNTLFITSNGLLAQQITPSQLPPPSNKPNYSSDFGMTEEIKRLNEYSVNHPTEVKEFRQFIQEHINNNLQKKGSLPDTTCTLTIPVVYHVFDCQGSNAVTLSQIQYAIRDLNTTFAGMDADYGTVNAAFASVKSYTKIRFALAQIDPKGNPTTGVVYYLEQTGGFGNDRVSQIASCAWDNYKYFNIYLQHDLYQSNTYNNSGVCWNPSTSMSDAGTARMVYNYGYLGSGGTSNGNLEFNQTHTHECGHYFGLAHTFGSNCTTDADGIFDTPISDIQAGGCNGTRCGHLINGENYMDYNNTCYKNFTMGQVTVMDAAIQHASRKPLWQYDNLVATGVLSPNTTNSCVPLLFSYSKTKLSESIKNDGSIETPPVKIFAVGGVSFAKAGQTLTSGSDYNITNVPVGLSVSIITASDNKSATITFSGNAIAHSAANSVANINLSLNNSAVSGGNVSAIINNSVNLKIAFLDPWKYACSTPNLTADKTNTWKSLEVSGPSPRNYGLWWDGSAWRFENYGKAVITTTAAGDNLSMISTGTIIGPTSAWRNAYPATLWQQGYSQPYIYSSTYTNWGGQTAYAGIRLQSGNDFFYGWMKLYVTAAGASVTILEYQINGEPNQPITAGSTCSTMSAIKEQKFEIDMNVVLLPNPSSESVLISGLSQDYIGGIFKIYSFDGKLAQQNEILSTEQIFDVSIFKTGIYFVNIVNKGNTKFANLKLSVLR